MCSLEAPSSLLIEIHLDKIHVAMARHASNDSESSCLNLKKFPCYIASRFCTALWRSRAQYTKAIFSHISLVGLHHFH